MWFKIIRSYRDSNLDCWFGLFPTMLLFLIHLHIRGADMETAPPPFSFDPVFMDDAKCAETNEKSIFLFLFFELSGKFIENRGDLRTK